MKVLVLSNGIFKEKEIDNTLEALQSEVNGYIEIPYLSNRLSEKRIDMIINEEGKMIDDLKIEIVVVASNRNVTDIIFGNIVFASNDDEGNTVGLTDEQIEFIKHELNQEVIVEEGYSVKLLWI